MGLHAKGAMVARVRKAAFGLTCPSSPIPCPFDFATASLIRSLRPSDFPLCRHPSFLRAGSLPFGRKGKGTALCTLREPMRRDDLLDLNDVLQHPGRELAVDISTELPDVEDLDLLRPLEGFLEAVSTGNLLLISGKFTGKMVFECARCSAPLEKEINFELEEQFPVEGTPSSLNAQDYARVVPDEPEMFDGNSLLVEALLRQHLLVALPMQALCEHGWDGPCPVAQARETAKKEPEHGRPEFEKLANLLHDEGPSS